MGRSAGNIFDKSRATIKLAHQAIAADGDSAVGAVNVRELRGRARATLSMEGVGGTTPTFDVTLEDSATSGGTYTVFATFPQVTADGIADLVVDMDQAKAFMKAVIDVGGTSPVAEMFIGLVSGANVLPTDES